MKYVIRHMDGSYLSRAQDGSLKKTMTLESATRWSHKKATGVWINSISPNERLKWKVKALVDEYTLENGEQKELENTFNWPQICSALSTFYKNLICYREEMNEKLSLVDLEITDIQHYIEFFTLDAARGYNAYRMLKDRLIRRRFIKDELQKVEYLISGAPSDFSSGKVDLQIKGMDTRRYSPRILMELFSINTVEPQYQTIQKTEKEKENGI